MTITPQQDEDNITQQLVTTVENLQRQLATQIAAPADDLEIKSTTGDYAVGDSWVGRRVVNTFDTTYKILIGGVWRTLWPHP